MILLFCFFRFVWPLLIVSYLIERSCFFFFFYSLLADRESVGGSSLFSSSSCLYKRYAWLKRRIQSLEKTGVFWRGSFELIGCLFVVHRCKKKKHNVCQYGYSV